MNTFRFSVNTKGRDKDWDFRQLASSFVDTEGTIQDVRRYVKSGAALCAGLLGGQWRSKANVIGSQWILIDIDNSDVVRDEDGKPIKDADGKTTKVYRHQLTLEEALAHPFIQQHCALIYTTASHKPEWPKFRLVFVLPEFVADVDEYEALVRAMMGMLPHDPACKDASRVFYGSTQATFPLVNPEATLPAEWLAEARTAAAVAKAEAEQARARAEQKRAEFRQQADLEGWDIDALIQDALGHIPPRQPGSGNYEECYQVLMALVDHYGPTEAEAIAERWSPSIKGSTWNIRQKIKSFRRGGVTIGTLFHIAKGYGFKFPKRSWVSRIAERLTKRPRPQGSAKAFKAKPGDTPYDGHEYEPGQRLATWKAAVAKDYKYILDQSGTGEGKSHDAGLAQPEDFEAKQLLYFSANHYAPATKTLADWPDLHGRNNGLTRDTMPDGSTKLRRAKRDEQRVVPANCGRTDLIGVLRAKNIQGADQANVVCRTCPLLDACQHAAGYGYGFLYQRKTALASPRLRLHPDSAPGDNFDYGRTVAIWEEFGTAFKGAEEIRILPSDVDATMAHLASVGEVDGLDVFPFLRPFLVSLRALFAAKQGRYGLGHEEVLGALALPTEENPLLEGFPTQKILWKILAPDLTELLDPELEDGLRVSDLPGRGVALGHERINLRSRLGVEDGAALAESQVLKQWLLPFLAAVNWPYPYQPEGNRKFALRLNFDTITLTVPTYRHRAIMQDMKANILLDATLTPEDAALMLGCEVDDIYVCRQRPAPVGNLQITQIADLGKMGMSRGEEQKRRASALIDHFKGQGALVIDFKKFEADGAWWADSRGSNAFQGAATLVLVGTPCQNLGALEGEYRALLGNLDGFEDWVNRKIHADILQGIGRLRANRRPGEALHLVLISDFDLDLPNVIQATAKDFTIKAASKLEKTEMAIRAAVAHLQQIGAKVTQTAVAKLAKVSQGYISRCFGELLQTLLGDSYSKSNNFEVDHPPPEVPPLVWGAIDLADTPQMLVDTIADLLNGLVDPHQLLAILLSGPPSSEPAA